MNFLFKIIAVFLFLVIFSQNVFALQVKDIDPKDYVSDYTNTLSSGQVLELSKMLGDLEKEKNIQVAVVVVPTIEDEFGNEDYIEHFAVKLFEKLKIGDEKKDNGLLWLIVKDKHEMRMEVGYGLEPTLTDGLTKIIQDKYVSPEFKTEKYFEGVKIGIEKIKQILYEEETSWAKGWDEDLTKGDLNGLIVFLFIIFVNLFGWIASILGRTKEWYLGGILAFIFSGVVGYSFFGIATGSVGAVVVITILGFVLDFFVSKNYKYWQERLVDEGNKHGPDWWAGGKWAPGSGGWTRKGGGSGFGGFGGGGMSGGGGSNSSW
jgi:uncharacterized protein